MVLEDEKVSENRKLRRLENQTVGDYRTCQPSYLPTFLLFTFLLSCFQNICVYSRSSVVFLFLFPLFYFLISGLT